MGLACVSLSHTHTCITVHAKFYAHQTGYISSVWSERTIDGELKAEKGRRQCRDNKETQSDGESFKWLSI